MPVMDGFEFVSKLDKVFPDIGVYCTIIMLSSSCYLPELERIHDHPIIRGFLEKPLDMEKIKAVLPVLFGPGASTG